MNLQLSFLKSHRVYLLALPFSFCLFLFSLNAKTAAVTNEIFINPYQASLSSEVAPSLKASFEKATQSIFERMTIPIIVNGKTTEWVKCIDVLQKEIRQIDSEAKLLPVGDSVRAVFDHINQKLIKIKEARPSLSAVQVLDAIASESDLIAFNEITGFDFNFAIQSPAGKNKLIAASLY